ncbi:MAG: hypothetical protein ABH803_02935 [Candidatus Micrarchaeota archaeon]
MVKVFRAYSHTGNSRELKQLIKQHLGLDLETHAVPLPGIKHFTRNSPGEPAKYVFLLMPLGERGDSEEKNAVLFSSVKKNGFVARPANPHFWELLDKDKVLASVTKNKRLVEVSLTVFEHSPLYSILKEKFGTGRMRT